MSLSQKLKHELVAVGLAMLYFGCWIAALMALKHLLLAEYNIAFHDYSMALVGALVLSKVVLILDHVSLGTWVRRRPAWMDVVLRTALCAFGVVVVMILEKSFKGRHEHGSFSASLEAVFQNIHITHVWVNALWLTPALLTYNTMSVIRRHLGRGAILKMLREPLPHYPKAAHP